jgi:propanol-preferring alcohol dehydrogenase
MPTVPVMLIVQQQRVIGSLVGSRADMHELLRLAVLYDIRPVTETYSLDKVNDVHERLRANDVRFRAVLTPS